MTNVLEQLNQNPKCKIKILTSVSNKGSLFLEQANDKIEWLHEFCPFIDTDTQFIATASNKRALVEAISSNCNQSIFPNFGINHILIDDFNKNLEDWRNAGGTAIKYINGINDPDSYNGLILDIYMSSDDIVELITNHINYLAREHRNNN
jgi:5'(3')-deoxyribonucleotidase